MKPENLKPIRRTVLTSWAFCALTFGYVFYNAYIRDWHVSDFSWATKYACSAEQISQAQTLKFYGCAFQCLTFIFILIFLSFILRNLKRGQIFSSRNHLWLLAASACTFIIPYTTVIRQRVIRDFAIDWRIILIPIAQSQFTLISLLLILFAFLYKIGGQLYEDQKLTI